MANLLLSPRLFLIIIINKYSIKIVFQTPVMEILDQFFDFSSINTN
jgi:hypothetical protein